MKLPIGISYSRVSGVNDERTASLDSQEEANVAKLSAEGYSCPPAFRFRENYTGMESIYEREVLMEVRELIRQGKAQAFCCYDTDRLARDSEQLVAVVADAEKRDCKVLFVNTTHESGRIGNLLLYIRGYASAIEYDQIKDRTMRGRLALYKEGKWIGQGPPRYGYTFDKETRRRTIDEATAAVVREIFQRAADGRSSIEIARIMNDRGEPSPSVHRKQAYRDERRARWGHTTIQRMIHDETYKGLTLGRRSEVVGRVKSRSKMAPLPREKWIALDDGLTDRIVDDDLWDAANAALSSRLNRGRVSRKADSHLFAGFCYCARCGLKMTPVTKQLKNRTNTMYIYRCTARFAGRKAPVYCPVTSVTTRKVDVEAWGEVKRFASDPSVVEAELARLQDSRVETQLRDDLAACQARRKAQERKLNNLMAAFADAETKVVRDALKAQVSEIEGRIGEADAEAERLEGRLRPYADFARTKALVRHRVERVRQGMLDADTLTYEQKRDIFRWLGVRVLASKDGIVVELDMDLMGPAEEGAITDPGADATLRNCAPSRCTMRLDASRYRDTV